jgi:hypothetical protein
VILLWVNSKLEMLVEKLQMFTYFYVLAE